MVPVDWVTLGLTLLVAFIASGAGIGGGGILLPIFVLIAGFKVHQAVALSNVTVLGSSFGNAILNIGKRHPSHDGPLIDWDLILIMEPMTIVGAVVGAYLQALLPGWVTASLLTLVLTLISRALLIKGISLYRRESRAMIDAPSSSGLAQPLLLTAATKAVATAAGRDSSDSGGGGGGGGGVPSSATLRTPVPLSLPGAHAHTHRRHGLGDPEDGGMSSSTELDTETLSWREGVQTPGRSGSGTDGTGADADAEDETTCEDDGWTEDGFSPFDADDDADAYIKMMHQEATQVPPLKLLTLVFLTAWMAGSDTAKGYLPCGSLPYWGVVASNGATCLLVTLVMQSHLLAKAALRRRMGRPPHAGAIRWTCANARLYPLLCSSAGIVAGMFGVGGGVVKGPLMLELGVQPEVASASSATMILFTTAAASVCNWHLGFLAADYGAALAGCAFVATLAGQVVMTAAVRRFGRPSLVVMIMFVLLSISAAAMYFSAFQKVASAVAHPDIAFQLSSICGVVPNATADGGDGGDDCQSAACLLLTNALA